ncbi:hypothetical protein CTEN210_01019 [Chaetoceros tenuissimus]|uniref:RING-type E3 ubiquitin transferase n=1 Tax=Chaetoceros tenuissimus TaxID=426638 RepID=A0AAD3CG77_9STRA|nr:hypothetical protein CTEN210_01019 [Chaetoceros tenuissimus]
MKPGTSLTSLYFLTFFCFNSTYGEALVPVAFMQDKEYNQNYSYKDTFVKRPNSSSSLQSYIFTKSSSSENANLQLQKACYPRCLTHKQQVRDHNYIQQQKDARVKLALYQRQLQRGSRPSQRTSSSKNYNNIVFLVCVSGLVFMIMVCVGLRYIIGIPQDRLPEVVTERKEVMKNMSEEEKRSVLEYIFKKQQKEEADKNTDFPSDLGDTESIQKKEVGDEDADEESLNSMTSVEDTNDSNEKSVNTIYTNSSIAAEDFVKDSHAEDDVCSICLDSFGEHFEAGDMLSAPNCSHSFHKECIMKWFLSQSSNLTCPDCRSQMFTVDELRAASKVFLDDANKDEKDHDEEGLRLLVKSHMKIEREKTYGDTNIKYFPSNRVLLQRETNTDTSTFAGRKNVQRLGVKVCHPISNCQTSYYDDEQDQIKRTAKEKNPRLNLAISETATTRI